MKEKIIIIGGGGHAKVVIDAIKLGKQYELVGIVDAHLEKGTKVQDCVVLGDDTELKNIFNNGIKNAFIAIGSVGVCNIRKRAYENLKKLGFDLPVIVHPKAVVATDVELGEGTFVAGSATINTGSKIGCNVIINTATSIDHDCLIGDLVHISPMSVLCGGVHIKQKAHIGAGARIIQNKTIGCNTIVGAGCTVINDLGDNETYINKQDLFGLLRQVKDNKVFIIAEAGVNHNGDIEIAKKLIEVAANCGVDAIKFQTFKAEDLVRKDAEKAEYQKQSTSLDESQFDMLSRLELNFDEHNVLVELCKKKGIEFISSPFDLKGIEFLNKLGVSVFKIPSGEITNLPYLRKLGSLGKPIIMSTGMANMDEVRKALDVLIDAGTPKNIITVLHCNTQYPTPFEDVNLAAILKMREELGVSVGYSDHTKGTEVSVAATILGATIIEKHFTLDKGMDGPDHKASVDPQELKDMIDAIRNVRLSIGEGEKKVTRSELRNRDIVRKSIVSSMPIQKGEALTPLNITTKRPADGINPMEWDRVIGTKAKRDFSENETIEL